MFSGTPAMPLTSFGDMSAGVSAGGYPTMPLTAFGDKSAVS